MTKTGGLGGISGLQKKETCGTQREVGGSAIPSIARYDCAMDGAHGRFKEGPVAEALLNTLALFVRLKPHAPSGKTKTGLFSRSARTSFALLDVEDQGDCLVGIIHFHARNRSEAGIALRFVELPHTIQPFTDRGCVE